MNVELRLTDLGNPVDQRNLVAFRLDQQTYALPIEPIVQIIEMVTITPLLQVSKVVEGVINVRGLAVPVVNLRCHFGLPEATLQLHTPIILVQVGERMVGLIVDEVIDVLSLPADQITRPADILPEGLGEAPLLQGLAHTPDGMVLLLDLEHLFLPSQVHALAQAAGTLSEVAIEEVSDESPVEARTEAVVEEASKESSVETRPQPARTRRRKRRQTRGAPEETHLDGTSGEVEA